MKLQREKEKNFIGLYNQLRRKLSPYRKAFDAFYEKLISFYERKGSFFLAKIFSFLLSPIEKALLKRNYCFLIHFQYGVGHFIPELDNFFRRLDLQEIDVNQKFVIIARNKKAPQSIKRLFGFCFFRFFVSSFIYFLSLPFLVYCYLKKSPLVLDCGFSRIKLGRNPIEKKIGINQWSQYLQRRKKRPNFFPLLDKVHLPSSLPSFLQTNRKRVLIQVNERIVNASACPTDPSTLLPTLEWLSKQNYQIVFVGRESMPVVFQNFSVIDYANSKEASLEMDIALFLSANFAIINGSGLFLMADCFNIPLLYINFWHIYMTPASSLSIFIPSLVKKEGSYLSFDEQAELYLAEQKEEYEVFPFQKYQAENITAEELLEGVKELLLLIQERKEASPLQKKFQQLDTIEWLSLSESRISKPFIQKYQHLLEKKNG